MWSGNVECGSKCDRTFVSQERQTKIDPSNVNFLERARRRCFCFLVILLHVPSKPFLPVLFSWYRYFWGNKATLANGKAAAFLNRSRTIRKGTNRGAETFLFFTLCLLQLATLIDVLSLPPTQLGDLRKKLYFWISILATLSSFVAHTQPDWRVWCMWQNWLAAKFARECIFERGPTAETPYISKPNLATKEQIHTQQADIKSVVFFRFQKK